MFFSFTLFLYFLFLLLVFAFFWNGFRPSTPAMNSGFEQILPHRDSAGRIVILYAPSQRQYKDDANWMRVMFYMGTQLMITASATNTHKIGNVFLHHGRGSLLPHQRGSFATVKKFEHVRDAFCLVMKACHFCYSGTDTETMKVLCTCVCVCVCLFDRLFALQAGKHVFLVPSLIFF